MEFACIILHAMRSQSSLLAIKEDIKTNVNKEGKSQASQNIGADKTKIKAALVQAIEIVKKCFNINSPKSVQKIGLFRLQPLINDYK